MTEWKSPKNLKGVINIKSEIKPFVNDYNVNIFNVAFLDEEIIQKFKSDFRIVADFFVQKRKSNNYKPDKQVITHVDEVLKFLQTMTGDLRYEIEFSQEEKERGVSMCNIIDKAINEGIEKGVFEVISRMLERGKSIQAIVEDTGYEVSKVQKVADTLTEQKSNN